MLSIKFDINSSYIIIITVNYASNCQIQLIVKKLKLGLFGFELLPSQTNTFSN